MTATEFNRVRRTELRNTIVYRFSLRPDAHRTLCREFETETWADNSNDAHVSRMNDPLQTAEFLVTYFHEIDNDPEEHAEAEALVAYLKKWQESDYRARTLGHLAALEERRLSVNKEIDVLRREIDAWS